MVSKIKHTQLTRTAYSYQDLICIRLLLEWYHEPDKYQWVSIEGIRSSAGVFKGLDDIIAFNKDNKYELYQVKFTTDSQRDDLKLDFEWLLKKKAKGTSLLQKWAMDVEKCSSNNQLSTASLMTNRIPDEKVLQSLDGNHIDINKIPPETLTEINEQLGGSDKSKTFFDCFEFDHSQQEIDDLEKQLHDSVVPDHTTTEGWLRFLKAVERWATRKNTPPPDGKISIHHIDELFKRSISKSLSQFFEIPAGYIPPSNDFHLDILEKTATEGCWVISGLPGIGKSTYLSYLTESLIEKNIPVIRHHYSLTSQSLIDRVSYPNVARSLQIQLQYLLPLIFKTQKKDPEKLSDWISLAADEFSKTEKTLVVIIDGLDHVRRERSDIRQLEHLVNRILPLHNRVCLIFGTQPISDSYLPSRMVAEIPRDELWLDLPAMDLQAIHRWLEELANNDLITLVVPIETKTEELIKLSEVFQKISGGYPLYLIYSIRSLISNKKYVTEYEIEKLPTCPDGDINRYYDSLWSNLSPPARKILLLISCVEFSWPNRDSIQSCFKDSLQFSSYFSEIQHLFETRRSGIVPFHSSIIVYLKNKKEFSESSKILLKKVGDWLSGSAPYYWEWGWKWIVEAQLGNPIPLLKGVTRKWLVESFCKGYPLSHIEHIISIAENIALDQGKFPELVRLRLIKIRLINGPEFQIQKYHIFLKHALKWSDEPYGLLWRMDNLGTLEDEEITVLASLSKDKDETFADDCFNEIIRRINFYVKSGDTSQNSKINGLIDSAVDILTDVSSPSINKICWFLNKVVDKEEILKEILKKLLAANNTDTILNIPVKVIPENIRPYYWNSFVLACCDIGISFLDRPESDQAISSVFAKISVLLDNKNVKTKNIIASEQLATQQEPVNTGYADIFFHSLVCQLTTPFVIEKPNQLNTNDAEEFSLKAESFFKYAAYRIADNLLKRGSFGIFDIYHMIKQTIPPKRSEYNYEQSIIQRSISKALSNISIDLYRLFRSTDKIAKIDQGSIEKLKGNDWWISTNWLNLAIAKNASKIIPRFISQQIIQIAFNELIGRKDNISTLTDESMDIVNLASLFELKNETQQCLNLTAQYILGYGWRKDYTFSELYEAITACLDHGVGNSEEWLSRVAPFTNDLFYFTERSGRHLPGQYINLIAKYLPERLVDEFDYHLNEHNWSIAHNVLDSFIGYFSLDTPAEKALTRSLTSFSSLEKLKKKANNNSEIARLYNEQLDFLGGQPPPPREFTSDSSLFNEDIEIDFNIYPPDKLNEFHNELKAKKVISANETIDSWISFWESKNEGVAVLRAYEKFWGNNTEFPYLFRNSLDRIFSLSFKLQGKEKSYIWAIRSIRINSHWSRYMGSRSEKKILKYAQIYAKEWQKFLTESLHDSSLKIRGDEWVIVPTCDLVKFLLVVGEKDLSREVTDVMLSILEEEISHLSLSPLYWYEKKIPKNQIASHLLLLYYKWPDRVARLRAAKEVANLLDKEKDFHPLYIEHLSKLNYEIDITDFLSILLYTEKCHFSLEDLTSSIKYPSILSDILLEKFGYTIAESEKKLYYIEIELDKYNESEGFKKAKNGIALLYFDLIDSIGEKIKYPLNKHLSAEWDEISKRQELSYFNHHDFFSDQFYPQDNILCSLSTQMESVVLSAYLRTLLFAHDKLGLPYDEAVNLALYTIPFSSKYGKLLPSSKPPGWSKINVIEANETLPDEPSLCKFLNNILTGAETSIILRANGPIVRKADGVNCDLEIRVIHSKNQTNYSAEEIYNSLTREDKLLSGIQELADCTYFDRKGRWEVDKLLRGNFKPKFLIGEPPLNIKTSLHSIKYYFGDVLNATWKYWHHNWYSAFYNGLGPSLGTYLTTPKKNWDLIVNQSGGIFYILGVLTIIDKRDYRSDVMPQKIYTMVEI